MRRVYLRGHTNIRKRLLIHTAGFNLGLLMRQLIGVGTPRGLQGRLIAIVTTLWALIGSFRGLIRGHERPSTRFTHRASLDRKNRCRARRRARNGFHHGLLDDDAADGEHGRPDRPWTGKPRHCVTGFDARDPVPINAVR